MKRHFILMIGCAALASFAENASAQPQPPVAPTQRPAFSPYMYLLNGNGGPALNYFGVVRPQMQLSQQYGQLQQQLALSNASLQQLQNAQYGIGDPDLPYTGHVATFNNTEHYFRSNPALGYGRGQSYGGGGGYGGTPSFNRYGSNGVYGTGSRPLGAPTGTQTPPQTPPPTGGQ